MLIVVRGDVEEKGSVSVVREQRLTKWVEVVAPGRVYTPLKLIVVPLKLRGRDSCMTLFWKRRASQQVSG